MMNDLISVIVPIYNSEEHLRKCINSILKQTYKNTEIILVNDGSTDSSLQICNDFALKDSRVRVINKINGGVSSARNLGIISSRGSYLTFIDSDDYCEKAMLQELSKLACKTNTDLVCSGYVLHKSNGKSTIINTYKRNYLASSKEEIGLLLENYVNLAYMVGKLFKRELIIGNNIRFKEQFSLGEDSGFVFDYILNIKSVAIHGKAFYHYDFCNPESLSTKYVSNIVEIYENTYQNKKRFESHFFGKAFNQSLKSFIAPISIYNNYKEGCPLTSKEKRQYIRKYMQDEELYREILTLKPSNRIQMLFLTLFRIRSSHLMHLIYSIRLFKVKLSGVPRNIRSLMNCLF